MMQENHSSWNIYLCSDVAIKAIQNMNTCINLSNIQERVVCKHDNYSISYG